MRYFRESQPEIHEDIIIRNIFPGVLSFGKQRIDQLLSMCNLRSWVTFLSLQTKKSNGRVKATTKEHLFRPMDNSTQNWSIAVNPRFKNPRTRQGEGAGVDENPGKPFGGQREPGIGVAAAATGLRSPGPSAPCFILRQKKFLTRLWAREGAR